jgi:crossover junction endodeoxyribonuclease RusA
VTAENRIVLTLPYPISANRYWRPVHVGNHISIVPTKEAKEFREQVGWLARGAGVRTPLTGRIAVRLELYPNRPQDWKTRQRKHGATWDDTVQCIDLTNAEKVLMDALNGVAFVDDKQVRRYQAERMEPDEKGARVVLHIEPIVVEQPQEALL